MITPEYARVMAKYNRWQNESLIAAAETLSEAERRRDRGAFFGSIAGTFSHILWADELWLSRFGAASPPLASSFAQSADAAPWPTFVAERQRVDETLLEWAKGLAEAAVTGELAWHSKAMGREIRQSRARLIAHMFNHQTHHRGQIHCMLTMAGARPEDTDIPFMPDHFEELTQ